MENNEEWRGIIQQWFVEPQLLDSDETKTEENRLKDEGLKRVIQKIFIKHQILGFDDIKPILEGQEVAMELFEAISKRESREVANEIFNNAIKEVKEFVAGEYDMAPRRKKEYEILAEKLEGRYGINAIDENVNRLITKKRGTSIGDSCAGGGCGSCDD